MFKKIQALIKGGKSGYEVLVPKIKKELKKRRETKEDIFKSVDEKAGKNIGISEKSKIKKDAGKKVSDIYDKYEKAITGKAKGGRIGYRSGELVDEDINVEGPGFDVNENIEMAEEPSPFEMRIQELMDEGMSWQEAYTIASEEFSMAEGQDESFSEQGLASLV